MYSRTGESRRLQGRYKCKHFDNQSTPSFENSKEACPNGMKSQNVRSYIQVYLCKRRCMGMNAAISGSFTICIPRRVLALCYDYAAV